MEELLKVLTELRPDVDFEKGEQLFDNRVLDSFDLVTLVGELNERFDISINVEDLIPENFNSASAMWLLIQRLKSSF